MTDSNAECAILAPVPLTHLLDGREVCEREGKVAFGSRAFEVLRQLDALRKGAGVDVWIYASHPSPGHALGAVVSWIGRYVGTVDSKNGAHPEGMRFRPPSTGLHPGDNKGHWAVFWEVANLRELAVGERRPITDFRGLGKRRGYAKFFVPEGPLLVEPIDRA